MTMTGLVERRRLSRQRTDGATLVCVYVLLLLLIPAQMVLAKLPLNIRPVLLFSLVLGVLWLSVHLVNTLAMGKGRNGVRTALVAYLCAHLLTYAVATRRYLPADELTLADNGIIRVLAIVAIGVFVCDGITSKHRLDRVLKTVVVAASVAAVMGLIQFALGVDPVAYFSVPGLRAEELGYSPFESRSIFRRPSGMAHHPIEFGLICAIAVPLATHYLFEARDRGSPAARWWLSLSLVGFGAIISLSRTAILGLAIAALVLIATAPGRRKLSILVVGSAAFLGAGVAVPGLLGTVRGMFLYLGSDPSVQGRTADYDEASAQIAQNPWLGRGFGTYAPPKYTILDNQYLLTLVENGYTGLTVLIALFLAAALATIQARRLAADQHTRGLAGSILATVLVGALAAATFDLLTFGMATGLVVLMIGAAGALLRIVRSEPGLSPAEPGRATRAGSAPHSPGSAAATRPAEPRTNTPSP